MYQLCGQPIRQLFEFNKEEQNKLIEEIEEIEKEKKQRSILGPLIN